MKKNSITRRLFFKQTALASTTFMIVSPHVLGLEGTVSPNNKLNAASIGVGGRGADDLRECESENIVALCDVDDKQAEKSYIRYEKAQKYKDFRVMLDKEKNIDAVIVSTPDHTHCVAALDAMQRGKHVYIEKPLAHSIYEVRLLMQAAEKYKVQTQLGNQGHSYHDIRKICEWIWDGAIGPVKEVHAWYAKPYGNGMPRPTETPEIPQTLNWDLWLSSAPERPYNPTYLPGKWRSWADFGTGVLGDWVCHILDPAFWALKLHAPTSLSAKNEGDYSPERFPLRSVIEYQFAAREAMPPVKVTWTYGKSPNLEQLQQLNLKGWSAEAGAILIGEKGYIYHGSHGGGDARLLPESRNKEYKKPAETIPRIPGGHHQDWIRACKDGKPACSNLSYGGPLTELALLGVIATKLDGETLNWDHENAKFTNNEKANTFIQPAFRKGWML